MNTKILLVEDDPVLGKAVKFSLELEGSDVNWAQTLEAGRNSLDAAVPDLVVLDLNLPDGHGLDLCKWAQEHFPSLPIIILTAQSEEEVVVRGLDSGARDYVRKPFSQKELSARVRSALRTSGKLDEHIKVGHLDIDTTNRKAQYSGADITLNRRQFDILLFFSQNHGRIVTRDMLLSHIGREGDIFDRTIDSHVSQLRRAIKKSCEGRIEIVSVYGVGYRLEIAS